MAERKRAEHKRPIETYRHTGQERLNNPPAGLVTPETDRDAGKKRYAYDPHLDPQLVWAGKAEHTSFEVPTVSLHVHERIEPRTIIEAVRKRDGEGPVQLPLFGSPQENPPLRQAIEFYKHRHGWSNRLIAGDSLLVMSSLLEKEGLAGKVQMIYIDPPYGIRYGSNFQPFVNKRDVKDGKDEDLTAEPEMIKAFRDTWELGIHSYLTYLTYLRDRLLLARELLHESGSVFVQISDENVHHVREVMDDVFRTNNQVATICYKKPGQRSSKTLAVLTDFVLWYAKDKDLIKYRQLYVEKALAGLGGSHYTQVELPDGTIRPLSPQEEANPRLLPEGARVFQTTSLTSAGAQSGEGQFDFEGRKFWPPPHKHWSCTVEGLRRVARAGRIVATPTTIRYRRYFDDLPVMELDNRWDDVGLYGESIYVVQTGILTVQRCVLMSTDPGDLVFDPTCGSGTTAYVAEQWGRRWITCDTSRVALTLARQRLMTAVYDYYELAHPEEGVGSGFKYKTVPHVTLKSIANNEPPAQETLYDQPLMDRRRVRVTGPFTVEAVPAPAVRSVDSVLGLGDSGQGSGDSDQQLTTRHQPLPADHSVARSGETLRQAEWRDELLRTGIRGKNGQYIRFARLEPLPGCRYLHADGETRPSTEGADAVREAAPAYSPLRVVVSFGPEHAPLEQRQVGLAIEEAQTLVPRPTLIVFAAFQFDPEAAKDIDETKWPGVTLLKAQMNADLLTDDLKKKRASNESFWLIGQPEVVVASEKWIVDSQGRRLMPHGKFEELSGVGGLAEIPGLGRAGVPADAAAAPGGAVRAVEPDATGRGVDSLEHRRRAIAELHRRVSAITGRGTRLSGRTGDPTADRYQADLSGRGGSGPGPGALRGDQQDAQRIDQIAQIEALTADHLPLTTRHYYRVSVHGFDYYNTKTGNIESGSADQIAVWLLDTDYDGRSLFPRQVFFPLADENGGWAKLARNLRAEIDPEVIEAYRGTVSLPFAGGEHRRIAVKIVDDRGIESLRVMELE